LAYPNQRFLRIFFLSVSVLLVLASFSLKDENRILTDVLKILILDEMQNLKSVGWQNPQY